MRRAAFTLLYEAWLTMWVLRSFCVALPQFRPRTKPKMVKTRDLVFILQNVMGGISNRD